MWEEVLVEVDMGRVDVVGDDGGMGGVEVMGEVDEGIGVGHIGDMVGDVEAVEEGGWEGLGYLDGVMGMGEVWGVGDGGTVEGAADEEDEEGRVHDYSPIW
jgi:hypothetical protein